MPNNFSAYILRGKGCRVSPNGLRAIQHDLKQGYPVSIRIGFDRIIVSSLLADKFTLNL